MKVIISAVAIIFAASITVYADLHNTFEKDGIAISGGFSMSGSNLGQYTDSKYDDVGNTSINTMPSLSLFIVDYLSIGFSPYYQYSFLYYYLGTNYNSLTTVNYGANISAQYFIVFTPNENGGFVPSIGISAGIDSEPGQPYTQNGVDFFDNRSNMLSAVAGYDISLNWFLTDTIAISATLRAQFKMPFNKKDYNGNEIPIDLSQMVKAQANLILGISFYMPFKDQALFKF
jgi:hypothetical protein